MPVGISTIVNSFKCGIMDGASTWCPIGIRKIVNSLKCGIMDGAKPRTVRGCIKASEVTTLSRPSILLHATTAPAMASTFTRQNSAASFRYSIFVAAKTGRVGSARAPHDLMLQRNAQVVETAAQTKAESTAMTVPLPFVLLCSLCTIYVRPPKHTNSPFLIGPEF